MCQDQNPWALAGPKRGDWALEPGAPCVLGLNPGTWHDSCLTLHTGIRHLKQRTGPRDGVTGPLLPNFRTHKESHGLDDIASGSGSAHSLGVGEFASGIGWSKLSLRSNLYCVGLESSSKKTGKKFFGRTVDHSLVCTSFSFFSSIYRPQNPCADLMWHDLTMDCAQTVMCNHQPFTRTYHWVSTSVSAVR